MPRTGADEVNSIGIASSSSSVATITTTPQLGTVQRSTAGAGAPGQSLKQFTGTISVATGATVALETVVAGKTLYITDIYVTANTATQFSVTINANATGIFNGFCKGDTGSIQLVGLETQVQAPALSVVNLVLGTAAATTAAWFISGFEQ